MRHNITLAKENSELLKELCQSMGLKPSTVIVYALRLLKRMEGDNDKGAK